MTKSGTAEEVDVGRALKTLVLTMIVGAVAIVIYAMQACGWGEFLSIVGVGVMVAGASLLLGGGLGFLFGIPRTLQQDGGVNVPDGEASAGQPSVAYRANTNLEQISDWLTKMLVGVGLTQLTSLPGYLKSITEYISGGLGDFPGSTVFAVSTLLYFYVIGFLFGYLWTRIYMASTLKKADQLSLGHLADKVDKADRKIDDIVKQSEIDAEALSLLQRQLNPSSQQQPVDPKVLDRAIKAASRSVKVQAFNQAWRIRGDNWKTNKALMETTIPIFKALRDSDTEHRYHMNHGQLGFALKDQRRPDWAEAEKELSIAIDMRGPWQDNGWLFYEFNRALCRIMIDEAFARKQPSDDQTRGLIVADLQAVWNSNYLRDIVIGDPALEEWMKLNDVGEQDLLGSE